MTPEEVLADDASRHHGLSLTEVYFAAGGTRSSLRRLLERAAWEEITERVLRAAAAPRTAHQVALAAVLDAGRGAVLTDQSSAALWRVPGFDLLPAEVLRPRDTGRRRLHLGNSHWATFIPPELVTVLDGIPTVKPAYLALLLFGSVHPLRAQRAAATMLSMRLASVDGYEHVLDLMGRQGRNGVVGLRTFVTEERRRGRPADSGLERRFESILRRGGESPMRRQVDIGDEDRWIGRTDLVDDELPLIVEIDSDRFHGVHIDRDADELRTKALEEAGFTVKRFTESDVWYRPDHVLAEVHRLRRELRQRRRPPAA
jgi:very-short-patch-repair endonuclease